MKLQILRADLGDIDSLRTITLEKLRKSKNLRNVVMDQDFVHFFGDPAPKGSFEKEPTRVDVNQALIQNKFVRSIDKSRETMLHNENMLH